MHRGYYPAPLDTGMHENTTARTLPIGSRNTIPESPAWTSWLNEAIQTTLHLWARGFSVADFHFSGGADIGVIIGEDASHQRQQRPPLSHPGRESNWPGRVTEKPAGPKCGKNIHKVGCRASGLLHTVTWGQRAPRPKDVKNVSKYEEIEPRGRSRGGVWPPAKGADGRQPLR